MKKVIFISALAIAAAASCTKSDIVDTKFNEAISFETYTGRDAQTKATPYGSQNVPDAIGLYGYYLGNATAWGTASKANLWENASLTVTTAATQTSPAIWSVANDPKYWANDADKYTFLAYAPITTATNTMTEGSYTITSETGGANPVINYTVPSALGKQIDILYAKNEGTAATLKGGVELNMHHALARLTVKATATPKSETQPFTFHVKKVSIKGAFNTSGTLNLYSYAGADWTTKNSVENTEYVFYTDNTVVNSDDIAEANKVVDENYANYAKGESGYVEGTTATNYLMMIPTDFKGTTETPVSPAELYVEYTTYYEGQESMPINKKFNVAIDFEAGKAYSIDLAFNHTATPITFKVTVEDWKNDSDVPGENTTAAGNPNGDATWTSVNAQYSYQLRIIDAPKASNHRPGGPDRPSGHQEQEIEK